MAALDLTIQVLDLSPKVTKADLTTFFSYCGTIDKIKLQRHGDGTQFALVTFKQPYAQQTALLLNDATILDRRVHIYPDSVSLPMNSFNSKDPKVEQEALFPRAQSVVQTVAKELNEKYGLSERGKELNEKYGLSERGKELNEKYGLSERGKKLTERAKSVAEKAVASVYSAMNGECFSAGAVWVLQIK